MDNEFEGALRIRGNQAFLDIEAKPNSKKPGLLGFEPWRKRFIVAVRAPPEKGKANKEVCETLSEVLGVKGVSIETGHTSHQKTAVIDLTDGDGERIALILKGYKVAKK